MSNENKQFMRRFVEEVINRKNLAALDEMVSEDFLERLPFPGQGPGRAGLKAAIPGFIPPSPVCIGRSRSRSRKEKRWSRASA